jgi:hypothetical protein
MNLPARDVIESPIFMSAVEPAEHNYVLWSWLMLQRQEKLGNERVVEAAVNLGGRIDRWVNENLWILLDV